MSYSGSVFRRVISVLYLIVLYIDARHGFYGGDRIDPTISLSDNLLQEPKMRDIIQALETTLEEIDK